MDYAAALVEQNRLLGELTGTADPTTPVPSCPDWTLRQLVSHIGRGDRWAATIVADLADAPVDIRSVPDGKAPTDPALAIEWLSGGAQRLLDAVAATGPDTAVWTFTGPQPAAWWVRRRLHEASVHRADAALALDLPYEQVPEVAADGISEWLSLLTARPSEPRILDLGTSLHLHATDDGLAEAGEWMIRSADPGIVWEHGHGKCTAAVRGRASDLLLAMLRRIPAEDGRLDVRGDAAVLTRWLERTGF